MMICFTKLSLQKLSDLSKELNVFMPISYQVCLFGCFTGISQLCRICVHTQLFLTLCNPMDYAPLGSSVHGIIPARILESVAISSFRESFWPRDQTCISGIGRQILDHEPPEKPISHLVILKKKIKPSPCFAKLLQSCPTLCDHIDGSPPGSPAPRILQARTLEWVAIFFSKAWKWKVKRKSLSRVWLLATPWTTAYQAPPSMGFSRQEY